MDNKTVRVALISVIVYLISKKLYSVFSKLFLWLNIKFHIYDENILFAGHLLIGIGSLLLLILIANKFLKHSNNNSSLFIGIILLLVIHTCLTWTNINYREFLNEIGIEHFKKLGAGNYMQESWIKIIERSFPILALLYFLFIMKKENNPGQ